MNKEKELKLEKIYEIVSSKELNFWCIIISSIWGIWIIRSKSECYVWNKKGEVQYICNDMPDSDWQCNWDRFVDEESIDKIIWHVVVIWDIFARMEEIQWDLEWKKYQQDEYDWIIDKIIILWKNKRWPIDEEDEIIDFIFDLIEWH